MCALSAADHGREKAVNGGLLGEKEWRSLGLTQSATGLHVNEKRIWVKLLGMWRLIFVAAGVTLTNTDIITGLYNTGS